MTREKVKLAYISNDSARKATFKKRKKSLMKKVNELSTLCGVNACAIVYSPYVAAPDVWPSPTGVHRVVSEFRMLPEMDHSKKMVNQEGFIRQWIAKATDHFKRKTKDNREKEMTEVLFQCLVGNMGMFHLNLMDLNDLGFLVHQYGKDVNRRIEILRKSSSTSEIVGESSSSAVVPSAEAMVVTTVAASTVAMTAAGVMSMDVGSSSSTLHPFHHYHQHHHYNPTVGIFDQPLTIDPSAQRHQEQWYMELMNHPEQMGFVSEELGFPFMNESNNHHHNATAAAAAAAVPSTFSSTATSTAGPSIPGNIWSGGFSQ